MNDYTEWEIITHSHIQKSIVIYLQKVRSLALQMKVAFWSVINNWEKQAWPAVSWSAVQRAHWIRLMFIDAHTVWECLLLGVKGVIVSTMMTTAHRIFIYKYNAFLVFNVIYFLSVFQGEVI